MDRLACWLEWKKCCALALCGDVTCQSLRDFAHFRFLKFLSRGLPFHSGPSPQCAVTATDAWHLFETHLVTTHTREGKRYKDWLFARVASSEDDPLDVVQGGATLIIRSVVRRHIYEEYPHKGHVSLQTVVSERGGQTLTLQDLLGAGRSPADNAAENEYDRLAETHSGEFFRQMPGRERVVLLAKVLGIPLNDPVVEAAAGRGKSTLCTDYQRFMRRIATSLVERYPDENKSAVMHLTLLTLQKLKKRTISWGKLEKRFARFFLVVEDDAAE